MITTNYSRRISVTVPGLSGLTKAYRSVLSATGSLEISGASRWDDISASQSLVTPRMAGQAGSAAGANQPCRKFFVANADVSGAAEHVHLAGGGVTNVHHQWLGLLSARPVRAAGWPGRGHGVRSGRQPSTGECGCGGACRTGAHGSLEHR